MMTATTFTKAEAKAHDALVAEQFDRVQRAEQAHEAAWQAGHRAAGDKRVRQGKESVWQLRRFQVRAQLERIGAQDVLDHIDLTRKTLELAAAELQRLEQIRLDNGNWQRFFIVAGGHIHASRSCHTLRVTTRLGWLPELSGETEETAVAEHGPLLCTVCFPSAPVEWTIGVQAPDDQCAGSGTGDYPRETARMGYYSGNYGVCSHCGERVTLTSTNRMRKHKRPK